MQRLVVFDGPGGAVKPYATAYDDDHERDLYVSCLVDHPDANAGIVENPPQNLYAGIQRRAPRTA